MTVNFLSVLKTLKKIGSHPAVILALVTFVTFFTTLVIRERTFYVFPDNIDQFFAWYQKLAVAIHHGTLPIWDANVSAGHSFVGELQAGVFYPVNLLWVWLFGSSQGISIFWLELIVAFHFWVASLGMYFAGRSIGLRKTGALAAGLVYAFGGGVAVRSVSQTAIFFGLCYVPWAFFWFQKWLHSHKKLDLLWCSVPLGFIILAGHIDPWYFACLIIALSIIFRQVHTSFEPWLNTTLKRLGALVVVIAGSLVIALPQVVLSAQYLPHAVRFVGDSQPIAPNQRVSVGTFTKAYSFKLQDTLSLVDPVQYPVVDGNEIYVGLVGLASVVFVLALFRRQLREHNVWRQQRMFIIGASAAASVVMIGYWTFIPAILRYLPLFSQIRQLARYSLVVQFCLALLVGICIEVIAANFAPLFQGKRRLLIGLAVGSMATSFLAINTAYLYLASKRTGSIDKHFVYQNAILVLALAGCLLVRRRVQYVLIAVLALSAIVGPVWYMPKIAAFTATYPPNYYRLTPAITYLEQYYGDSRVLIENNALPVNIGDVYRIQTVGGYGATLHQAFYNFEAEKEAANQTGEHLNLLNVRFVVDTQSLPQLKKVFTDNVRHIFIYERPQYAPRAYFASQLDVCTQHITGCSPITITDYQDADIKLHYQASSNEILVLSEVNYFGWKAYIDGKTTTIKSYSPTNTKLFRSIAVPAGSHNVEFRYQPLSL